MKKYYIHNGTEQQGPFDLDDLKAKGIHSNTSVWYDELADWTTAGKVDELKELLKTSTPPPFGAKQTPPPIQKPQVVATQTAPKKTSIFGTIRVIIILLLIIGALIVISNNPNVIPGIKVQVNTPKPVVITTRYDDKNSSTFKEKGTIYTTVQNQGGDGNVLVTFNIKQAGNNYDRNQSIYLRANQTQDLSETFDEVTRLGGKIIYSTAVKAE